MALNVFLDFGFICLNDFSGFVCLNNWSGFYMSLTISVYFCLKRYQHIVKYLPMYQTIMITHALNSSVFCIDWSLRSMFDRSLYNTCPMASESQLYVDTSLHPVGYPRNTGIDSFYVWSISLIMDSSL